MPLVKPDVGQSRDTWGTTLNATLDYLDTKETPEGAQEKVDAAAGAEATARTAADVALGVLIEDEVADRDAAIGAASTTDRARSNHTGTQSADTITDGTTNKAFLDTERIKLSGIATSATANSADATLLARANHTGTQAESTITNLVSDLAGKQPIDSDLTDIAALSPTEGQTIAKNSAGAWAAVDPPTLLAIATNATAQTTTVSTAAVADGFCIIDVPATTKDVCISYEQSLGMPTGPGATYGGSLDAIVWEMTMSGSTPVATEVHRCPLDVAAGRPIKTFFGLAKGEFWIGPSTSIRQYALGAGLVKDNAAGTLVGLLRHQTNQRSWIKAVGQ